MINEKIAKKKALCEILELMFDTTNSKKEYLKKYLEDQKECLENAKKSEDNWAIERYEREIKEISFQNEAIKLIETSLEKML